jgi:FixJ family two-component response regulator
VVDDDLAVRQLSAQVLDYHVDAAEDGWEALHAGNYDLLITDNNMPKVSGFELGLQPSCLGLSVNSLQRSESFPKVRKSETKRN